MLTDKDFKFGDTADLRIVMAENLKKRREAKGFTQAQMAEIAHVEVNTYQRYEYANLNVPMSKIFRLSRALGCTVDELLVPPRPRGQRRSEPAPRSLGGRIRQRVMKILRRPSRKGPLI